MVAPSFSLSNQKRRPSSKQHQQHWQPSSITFDLTQSDHYHHHHLMPDAFALITALNMATVVVVVAVRTTMVISWHACRLTDRMK